MQGDRPSLHKAITAAFPSGCVIVIGARSALRIGFFASLSLALLATGYASLFSAFSWYDDEGYILLTLQNFHLHAQLYEAVYSQYGPFFYLWSSILSRTFGFIWSNENARFVTLGYWLSTAILCAYIVWKPSRDTALAAMSLVGTFVYLVWNVSEPSHPGSLIALLVSLAALAGVRHDISKNVWAASVVGFCSAALFLIKLNVGGLLLIAVSVWMLPRLHIFGSQASTRTVMYSGLSVLPWALMHQRLDDESAMTFAIIWSSVAIGLWFIHRPANETPGSWIPPLGFLLSAVAVSLGTIAFCMLGGTSINALLSGVLIAPMQHAFVNYQKIHWLPGSLFLAVGMFGTCIGLRLQPNAAIGIFVATAVRFGLFLMLVWGLSVFSIVTAVLSLSYGISCIAILAFQSRSCADGAEDARIRGWLALLLLTQSLHAYPNAGSQVAWGTFLIVPLSILAVRDSWLGMRRAPMTRQSRPPLVPVAVGLCMLAILSIFAVRVSLQYVRNDRLDLPGTGDLRLPPLQATGLRAMTDNAKLHASMLFSLPGRFSFNLWSGVPTPTLANVTAWPLLLDAGAQNAIKARLMAEPRPMIIRWANLVVPGDLGAYIAHGFEPVMRYDAYELLAPVGHPVVAISVGKVSAAMPGRTEKRLELTLRAPEVPITSIELWRAGLDQPDLLARWTRGSDPLSVAVLNDNGQPRGSDEELSWPVMLPPGIVRLRAWYPAEESKDGALYALLYSGTDRVGSAIVTADWPRR